MIGELPAAFSVYAGSSRLARLIAVLRPRASSGLDTKGLASGEPEATPEDGTW
jgi:hypothetical protein